MGCSNLLFVQALNPYSWTVTLARSLLFLHSEAGPNSHSLPVLSTSFPVLLVCCHACVTTGVHGYRDKNMGAGRRENSSTLMMGEWTVRTGVNDLGLDANCENTVDVMTDAVEGTSRSGGRVALSKPWKKRREKPILHRNVSVRSSICMSL